MGTSLKPRLSTARFSSMGEMEKEVPEKWSVRLSLAQLLVLWTVVAIAMLAVFFTGLYAGRDQGLKIALEEHGAPAIRFPVAAVIAEKADLSPPSGIINPLAKLTDSPAQQSSSADGNERLAFDFTTVSKPAAVASSSAPAIGETNSSQQNSATKRTEVPGSQESSKVSPHEPPMVAKAQQHSADLKDGRASPTRGKIPSTTELPVPKGWFVQLAATDSKVEAIQLASRLKSSGTQAVVREAKVADSQYYRVLVGPYSSKESADKSMKQLLKLKVSKGQPFVKNY